MDVILNGSKDLNKIGFFPAISRLAEADQNDKLIMNG